MQVSSLRPFACPSDPIRNLSTTANGARGPFRRHRWLIVVLYGAEGQDDIAYRDVLDAAEQELEIPTIYAVAKAGMTHYTRCLADQLRSYDINVNCIAPGDTRTGRFMGTRAVDQERMVETGTLDRIATVDEVARVVEVFAGPLGAFVSGQVLRVDGGGQCWAA